MDATDAARVSPCLLLLLTGCMADADAPIDVEGPRERLVLGRARVGRSPPGGDAVRVDAWARPVDGGVQQGWVVHDPPGGDGPLVVSVPVGGGVASGGADTLYVRGEAGGLWRIDGLAAWDADGQALGATFAPTDDGYSVRVDDRGARYPLSIDPIVAAVGVDLGRIGYTQSTTADFDGDGYDDLLTDAVHDEWFLVWPGGPAGPTTSTTLDPVAGMDARSARAGDFNGDGYDDVALAWFDFGPDTGMLTIHYGSVSGLSTSPAVSLVDEGNTMFGYAVGVGDTDGDGYDDVLTPADGGWVAFAGSAAGLRDTPTAARRLDTRLAATELALDGDFDADGDDDLGYGASSSAHADGTVLVYRGSPGGVGGRARRLYAGGGAGSEGLFGYAMSTGDVTGDGYDDLVVGARDEGSTGGAYLYTGGARGLLVDPAWSDHGTGGVYTGLNFDVVGDSDGDGDDELVLGEVYTRIAGQIRVFAGGAGGPTEVYDITGLDLGYSAACGYPYVAGGRRVGDVNGDGYPDVAVMVVTSPDGSCGGAGYNDTAMLLWGAGP